MAAVAALLRALLGWLTLGAVRLTLTALGCWLIGSQIAAALLWINGG